MTPQDWTLMTIAAAGDDGLQPVQLQKAIFLLARNLSSDALQVSSFYEFSPYDYGPFCSQVYADAEALEKVGAVAIKRPPQTRYREYTISESGSRTAREIEARVDEETRDYLHRVVQFVRRLSFNQLVSAIYRAYPEMKENSVFGQARA